MMTPWRVGHASILGRDHAALRRNRQDAAASANVGRFAFGVVADGCGQGEGSEVGARLSVIVACDTLEAIIERSRRWEALDLAEVICAVTDALRTVASLVREGPGRAYLVREHLLSTLVGFVASPSNVFVFASGDGSYLVDDELVDLDCDNRPSYLGQELDVEWHAPVHTRTFDGAKRVAVATDGVDASTLKRLVSATKRAPSPLDTLLCRELRIRQREGALGDDGSVAIAERAFEEGPRARSAGAAGDEHRSPAGMRSSGEFPPCAS